jgi:SNF2 family DNA or RNA helicase
MPASCYYLVARDTIEEKLCEVIQRKQRILESVLDGGDGGDLDIYDALLEEMRKG